MRMVMEICTSMSYPKKVSCHPLQYCRSICLSQINISSNENFQHRSTQKKPNAQNYQPQKKQNPPQKMLIAKWSTQQKCAAGSSDPGSQTVRPRRNRTPGSVVSVGIHDMPLQQCLGKWNLGWGGWSWLIWMVILGWLRMGWWRHWNEFMDMFDTLLMISRVNSGW